MSLNDEEKGFLGMQALGLTLSGTCERGDSSFNFEAPINTMRIAAEQVAETSQEVLKMNPNAKSVKMLPLLIEIGDLAISGIDSDLAVSDEIRTAIIGHLN